MATTSKINNITVVFGFDMMLVNNRHMFINMMI